MADVVQLFGSIDKEVNKVFQKNQLNVQYNVFLLQALEKVHFV